MSYEKAMPILIEAIKKNLELWEKSEWKRELIDIAPPVLWFGNFNSPKEKVLTIGANPSRCEFLERNNERVCREPLKKPRFAALSGKEDLESLLGNKKLLEKIIDSYNSYFEVNPYSGWFGIKDGGKVEGFVNGLRGSFYEGSKKGDLFTAIHTDLFPFPTKEDFKEISNLAVNDLFKTNWARKTLSKIVELVRPKVIIVFGGTNANYHKEYFGNDGEYKESPPFHFSWHKGRSYGNIPTALINMNLGNPYGASKLDLNDFGEHVGKHLGPL